MLLLEEIRAADIAAGGRQCRGCGCTENTACEGVFGEGCHWVEPDLCSECVDAPDLRAEADRLEHELVEAA